MKKIISTEITDTEEKILIACFILAIPLMIDAIQRMAKLAVMLK